MSVSMADWRRWAAIDVLARRSSAIPTQLLRTEIQARGWGLTLGTHGQWDALHRTLLSLERRGYVRRLGRPSLWEATDNGRFLWREFIADNPNITAEALEGEQP